MCCKCHECFIISEVVTSGANVQFPENNRIRTGFLQSIMLMRANGTAVLSPTGKSLAVDLVLNSSYAYFKNSDGTDVAQIPLAHLVRDPNSPEPLCVRDWQQIDLSQSSIVINTAAAGYSATAVFVFTFGLKCNTCGVLVPSGAI